MSPRKAVHFGIVFDTRSNDILRIFNPTFEFELDLHRLGEHEKMLRLKKTRHGIARSADGMTVGDAAWLLERYGKRS